MDGIGTDTDLFYKTLNKIQNLYTFEIVNETYKAMYKESLTDAMLSESKLTGSYSNAKKMPTAVYVALAMTGIGTVAAAAIGLTALSNKLDPKIIDKLSSLPEA